MNRTQEFLLTFFYIGYITSFPGTIASFFSAVIWFYIPNAISIYILIPTLIIAFYFCYKFSITSEEKDPSYIVIDEVVGMFLSLLFLPKNILLYCIAFILFRFFDIMKPSIIYHSQKAGYGVGIILDDLLAGLIVLLIMQNLYFAL